MMRVKPRKLSSPSSIIGQAGLMGMSHHKLMLSTSPQMDAKSTKGGGSKSVHDTGLWRIYINMHGKVIDVHTCI